MRTAVLLLLLLHPALACSAASAAAAASAASAPAAASASASASASAPVDVNALFYAHAADCTAALEIDQLAMARRAKAGEAIRRDDLLGITQYGFTFIGVAYKRGLREPLAGELLKAARVRQKAVAEPLHRQAFAACHAEGKRLFDDLSGAERWLLGNRADAKVDKLLRAP